MKFKEGDKVLHRDHPNKELTIKHIMGKEPIGLGSNTFVTIGWLTHRTDHDKGGWTERIITVANWDDVIHVEDVK